MPSLPNNPSLDKFRRQARTLQRAARSGDATALEMLVKYHPSGIAEPAELSLSAAQLVVARGYGFSSWPRLKHYLDQAAVLGRNPTIDPADETGSADIFCRLACLVYSEVDDPARWARARALLESQPDLVSDNLAAAAAAADPDAISVLLSGSPGSADREVGPHRWTPLMYLAYSRVWSDSEPAERFLQSATLLLDAGADVNAGYLWLRLPTPFTVLTGVLGEGEQGAGKQPRHPYSMELARLLLTRGADPNDGQALYNRMFRPDNSHLELLFEFGAGRGDGGPWKRRLGEAAESPAQMLARQWGWAIDHGFDARVRLLIGNGIDVDAPLPDGHTPIQHAVAHGRVGIIEILRAAGVAAPPISRRSRLVGRLLAGDRSGALALIESDPGVLSEARDGQPGLIGEASTPAAVALLAEQGFDINARSGGKTALHDAAWGGDAPLIRALLDAGADPLSRDDTYNGTSLDWASYARQPAAADLLAGYSASDQGQ
jgi:ankyrin repeat protein